MTKRNRILSSVLAACMLTTVAGGAHISADSLKDLQNERKATETKKNSLNSTIEKKNLEIKENQSRANQLIKQIKSLNAKIDETNDNMDQILGEMNKTKKEIHELKESIKIIEKRIEERDEVLRERIRAMQVRGGKVSYIDVLIGANSFADFIDRFSAVSTLMDADRQIIVKQEEDMALLEEEKAQVEQKLAKQDERRKQIQALKDELLQKKLDKRELVMELEKEQDILAGEKANLEEQYDETIKMSDKLEKKINAEQDRLAEIARKEQQRKMALYEQQMQTDGDAVFTGDLPAVSSGFWTKPTTGKFSSGFGWRTHPITHKKKQHRGLDLSAPTGTPVVSAADGVVSYAGQMEGLGNVIMITHSVKDEILTTVYGHLSSIGTSSGKTVEKGELIGAVGQTGFATGPHLHFEVHVGNFSATGPSAVNPLHYVSF